MSNRKPPALNVQIDEAIVALDLDQCVMSANGAADRLFGKLIIGGRFDLDLFWDPDQAARMDEALRTVLTNGKSRYLVDLKLPKAWLQKSFGLVCMLNALFDGPKSISGAILVFREMSEGRATGRAFETADDRRKGNGPYMELLEALPEGVFTINTHWQIISFNAQAERITGYAREEVLGHHCWEIFNSDLCQLNCPLRVALETGRASMDQDIRIIKKGGHRQTILVNAGVLRAKTGKVIGAVETFRPLAGEVFYRSDDQQGVSFGKIIGRSSAMQRIYDMLADIAASDASVLITGESGTGKDLIARTLHDHSSRRNGPFVAVNCSALAETLLESELFGHEKAAFTGAVGHKIGRFEMAKGGTLFLDEIGELRPELQIKLLRVLENREFERVGGTRSISMEARIISATNRDLRLAIEEGRFREDFFYRLRTVPLNLPPLRERPEDIADLVRYFVRRFNRQFNKRVLSVHPQVMKMFMRYHWPGNVRELERTLEHAYVFVKGPVILPTHLPVGEEFNPQPGIQPEITGRSAPKPNADQIRQALDRAEGRRHEAARLLGISRTTLWRYIKQFSLAE